LAIFSEVIWVVISDMAILGLVDYLSSDKRFIKMFCSQLLLIYLHGLCAAIELVVIAISIVM